MSREELSIEEGRKTSASSDKFGQSFKKHQNSGALSESNLVVYLCPYYFTP